MYPSRAILHVRRLVTKDFPTPPLPLTIPITLLTELKSFNLSFGKQKQIAGRRIENSDTDTGILSGNK